MSEKLIKCPPFKIKMTEPVSVISKNERLKRIAKAGYNPFLLNSEDIFIDLLTDSGTGAMSEHQWSAMMLGDETYAGSESFGRLAASVKDIMGLPYLVPCHQGRGAENVLNTFLVKPGDFVPGNLHFDTTVAHIEKQGAKPVDCTIKDVHVPGKVHKFKGNLDLNALEKFLKNNDRKRIPYVLVTITCNSGGGQPVSMANIKGVRKLTQKYGVRLLFDAARFAENAYFIKTRETGYANVPIRKIVREMFSYVDGCTMSAKKDGIGNIGGFLGIRSKALYQKLCEVCVVLEGFPTYGGMSGRDMEAIAVGLYEATEVEYLEHRVGQVAFLGKELQKRGVPIVLPTGGHAVFVDGDAFYPHIPREQYPAHTLCVEAYIEGGIRLVEIGTLLAGRDPETGKNKNPKLELARMTIPRRVYSSEHLLYCAQVVGNVYANRKKAKGLKFTYEAPVLRHFQSRFRRV